MLVPWFPRSGQVMGVLPKSQQNDGGDRTPWGPLAGQPLS